MSHPPLVYRWPAFAAVLLTTTTSGAPINLTELTTPPGVVNAAAPPSASVPFDQAVPYRITSDSARAIYIEGNAFHVISFATPGQPLRLTESLVGDIREFELSGDGQWLVYTLETTSIVPPESRQQIYSVRLDASLPPSPIGSAAVFTDSAPGGAKFRISSDSQHVVFRTSEPANDPVIPNFKFAAYSLFRAPISGGTGTAVAGPANAIEFDVAEDSSRIVFAETRELGFGQLPAFDLFSVPLVGAPRTQINGPAESTGPNFDVTRDGLRVIYTTLQESDPTAGKLVAEPAGGGVQSTLAEYDAQRIGLTFAATPDGQRVIFASLSVGGPAVAELRSVAINGTDRDLLSSGLNADLIIFQLSDDSTRAVFTAQAGPANDLRSALYTTLTSAALGSGSPARIAGDLDDANGALLFPHILLTPDSQYVVYGSIRPEAVNDQKPGSVELRRVAIDGSGPMPMLNQPLAGTAARILYSSVSFDSQRAFYIADQAELGVFELYATPLAEPAVEQLNGDLPGGGDVAFAFWSLDSGKVIYQADEAEGGLFDLWLSQFSNADSIFDAGFE